MADRHGLGFRGLGFRVDRLLFFACISWNGAWMYYHLVMMMMMMMVMMMCLIRLFGASACFLFFVWGGGCCFTRHSLRAFTEDSAGIVWASISQGCRCRFRALSAWESQTSSSMSVPHPRLQRVRGCRVELESIYPTAENLNRSLRRFLQSGILPGTDLIRPPNPEAMVDPKLSIPNPKLP